MNGVLGLLVGLALAVMAALLMERLDRRLRDDGDAEEAYRLPILGQIPESKTLRTAGGGMATAPMDAEAFQMLRARLRYFNVDRELRSVLITSVGPGEGKTTVALNLAVAAARSEGFSVLLIEADMRRPQLATRAHVLPFPGLAEVLSNNVPASEAIQAVPASDRRAGRLDILVAGSAPPNPYELLESHRMEAVLKQFVEQYDLVIIDSPPNSIVSDAIPLMQRVSGVMVVSRLRQTTRDGAAALREQLASLKAPTLGVVVNGAELESSEYYSYGPPSEALGKSFEFGGNGTESPETEQRANGAEQASRGARSG